VAHRAPDAHAAAQPLEYVRPSVPHTGWYSAGHTQVAGASTHWPASQVKPAPQVSAPPAPQVNSRSIVLAQRGVGSAAWVPAGRVVV
jgi:hypothetical protein